MEVVGGIVEGEAEGSHMNFFVYMRKSGELKKTMYSLFLCMEVCQEILWDSFHEPYRWVRPGAGGTGSVWALPSYTNFRTFFSSVFFRQIFITSSSFRGIGKNPV